MKVIATLQAEGQNAVEMPWANHADDLGVIQSVVQLLQHDKDESPFTPRTRRIVIEISDVVEYDCEHGLSKALCEGPNHYPADHHDEPPF